MAYDLFLLVVGVGVLAVATAPRVLHRLPVSLPAIQVLTGVLLFGLVGALPDIDVGVHDGIAERLSELVVIVSLTGAGLKIDQAPGWRSWQPTWRLLAIAMPLTIAATAALGSVVLGLAAAPALLLGAVIAPTDPVLASEVQVGGPNEGDDEVRLALTAEAGLNDALAFPFVNLALAVAAGGAWFGGWVLDDVVIKLGVGVLVGLVAGALLGRLVVRTPVKPRAMAAEGIAAIGATIVVYTVTELVHGYGFLAVFVAAVAARSHEREHERHEVLHDAAEAFEQLGSALLLVLVGGAIASGALGPLTWEAAGIGLAVVFVVRPVVGWLSLIRTGLTGRGRTTVATMGIRGMGSVFYLAHAAVEGDVGDLDVLWAVVLFVIALSVLVHGAAAGRVVDAVVADDDTTTR